MLIRDFLHVALLQSPLQLDYPSSTDSEFFGQERGFAAVSTFPTEDVVEQHHRTAASLGHALVAHPNSLPVTNGLRYGANHPGLHNVP